jgi:transcriptional regulator with XRE-family HTH domain
MKDMLISNEYHESFGEYIKIRREALGKSIRGLALELNITPAYLSDIEKGNRCAPERFLEKMTQVLCIPEEELYYFYDLAGKSRNNIHSDLIEYIGKTEMARVALRKARDLNISNTQWKNFIDEICGM